MRYISIRFMQISAIFLMGAAILSFCMIQEASAHSGDGTKFITMDIESPNSMGTLQKAQNSWNFVFDDLPPEDQADEEEQKEDSPKEEYPSPYFLLLVFIVGFVMFLISFMEWKESKSMPQEETEEKIEEESVETQ
ncbi:MAG: hypothetical protein JSW00_00065 [Thermoplasmata archaeon]|nr:MAG: hypothetical protein JSW00_00065 [Thermoplasmata archaeon]